MLLDTPKQLRRRRTNTKQQTYSHMRYVIWRHVQTATISVLLFYDQCTVRYIFSGMAVGQSYASRSVLPLRCSAWAYQPQVFLELTRNWSLGPFL
jgi:hypothetical protein